MMGAGGEEHLKGIIPRLCDVLFERIAEVQYMKLMENPPSPMSCGSLISLDFTYI